MLLFDFGEGGFEAPPLRFVLFAALSFCEGVGEGRCVLWGRGGLVLRLERGMGENVRSRGTSSYVWVGP